MKLGSLFDGAGTFPFGAMRYGIKPIWASEIEPFCVAVTTKNIPQMKHLGDITKINGAEIEPVDIITFGSPCQGLSIAGKGTGLADERSSLFMEAIRIIKEMLEVTNGEYPNYAVWENVPGAFSSNERKDFRVVLEELCKIKDDNATIPRPTANKGKWTNSGLIVGDGFSVAWRVLDAQYWGVPQRRRRIYVVVDFRGGCAGQILFERDGLSRNFAEIRETWKGITRNSTIGSNATRQCYDTQGNGNGELSPTITGDHNNRITDYTAIVVEGVDCYNQDITGNKSMTITAKNTDCHHLPCVLVYNKGTRPHNKDEEQKWNENPRVANTLNVNDLSGETRSNELVVCCSDETFVDRGINISPALKARNYKSQNYINTQSGAVRRIAPKECARLQGMPDWWCDDIPHADSAEYKMWGNGMALPCVMYILEGIIQVEDESK